MFMLDISLLESRILIAGIFRKVSKSMRAILWKNSAAFKIDSVDALTFKMRKI